LIIDAWSYRTLRFSPIFLISISKINESSSKLRLWYFNRILYLPFFSKDKATKKPFVSCDRVYQRTSKSLGVSYTSVHRIMNDKRSCKSNRPNVRAKLLVDFDHCVKYIYPNPKNYQKIGPKCSLSQNNKKHYNNIFS
jgi:hypothetical protein